MPDEGADCARAFMAAIAEDHARWFAFRT